MITPEELIQDLIDFYGYEVDLSYAINYIDMVCLLYTSPSPRDS